MFLAWEEGALPRAPRYLEDAEEMGKGKERKGGRGPWGGLATTWPRAVLWDCSKSGRVWADRQGAGKRQERSSVRTEAGSVRSEQE